MGRTSTVFKLIPDSGRDAWQRPQESVIYPFAGDKPWDAGDLDKRRGPEGLRLRKVFSLAKCKIPSTCVRRSVISGKTKSPQRD